MHDFIRKNNASWLVQSHADSWLILTCTDSFTLSDSFRKAWIICEQNMLSGRYLDENIDSELFLKNVV